MIKKILSVVLAAVMLCVALVVPASAASLEDLSTEISSGVKIKEKFGKSYASEYYKIKVSESGELKLKFITNISNLRVSVYDSDGDLHLASDYSATNGKITVAQNLALTRTGNNLWWKSNIEKFSGTLYYKVKKGTYYIEVRAESVGKGTMNMTPTFPSNDSPETESIELQITMNVGDEIRLGAIVSPDGAEEVKWSTTKKSVASVSSKGKVTAKGEGTATIKAKSGSKVLKIKIVVEE